MALKQGTRVYSLKTPLGENELLLTGFQGQEEMSRLFRFQLDMISDNNAINAPDIVGKNVTFSIKLADESERFFNGFVNRFLVGDEDDNGRRDYRMEVVPWLWFLTQTADCRIFQHKKVPDIIEQVFQDLGFSDFEMNEIKGNHKEWEYCVQYRETDFNFVSRLMEQEGIFFYFRHEDGKHVMVLADQKNAYKDCQESEVDFPRQVSSQALVDHITSWEHRYEFRTGKWAHTDYNFKKPSTSLMANTDTLIDLPDAKKYEVYDYPGEYAEKSDGDGEVKLRMEEEEVEYDVVEASSLCKTFTPGGKFKIKQHHSSNEEGKTYAITSISHAGNEPTAYETGASGGDEYHNSFTCIPSKVSYRPARLTPKPIISGIQTAIVVGPSGEEIFPDEFGRVKVQFHWDRKGKKDENSSCWIRVSQVHAGKGFGGIDLPRIGEEVIITFLEGDPDRPVITGRLYHAENMPPFGLPGSKTISGLKSNSTKGGGGYNEYVMDDTKGNELIREHGQFDKDSTIEHDLREHVLNDRSRDVTRNESITIGNDRKKNVDNDETTTVHGNRTETVDKNETITIHGARTETVDKDEKITIHGGRTENVDKDESITIGGNQKITIGEGRTESVAKDEKITIGGGRTETVAKDEKITISGGRTESVTKDENITISGGRTESVTKAESVTINDARTHTIAKDDTLSVGKNLTVTAGDSISLTTGKASIVMKKDGTITITGQDITITGKGQITGKATKDMVLKGKKILQN